MQQLRLILVAIAITMLSITLDGVAQAGTNKFSGGSIADGAPEELTHWNKLIGQWLTTEERLKQDGSGWEPANGASWDFFWGFDGWGIQDNYTSPPLSEALEDESKRQRGVNLRIYNPAENHWVMTWLTTGSTKPMTMTATSNEQQIVLLTDEKNPQGFFGRITFFDMQDASFEWKLERSSDRESWREV